MEHLDQVDLDKKVSKRVDFLDINYSIDLEYIFL